MPYSKTISTCCCVCQLPKKGNKDKFYPVKKNRDGLMGRCKKCTAEQQKEYRQRPKSLRRDRERGLRAYGLTLDTFNALLDSQDGRCAICKSEDPGGKGCFHVDHCHVTDEIRGLLCHNCNLMLGQSKDNVQTLRNAIRYLER